MKIAADKCKPTKPLSDDQSGDNFIKVALVAQRTVELRLPDPPPESKRFWASTVVSMHNTFLFPSTASDARTLNLVAHAAHSNSSRSAILVDRNQLAIFKNAVTELYI